LLQIPHGTITDAGSRGNFERAAALIDQITTAPELETFITLSAYRVLH